jgi:ankyrin repeat protein
MTRSLPLRPNLDSDRKRAKSLKKAHARREAEALSIIREHHPRFRGMDLSAVATAPFRLSDAQLVVAREYGVESWPRLIALIAFLRADLSGRARLFTEAAVDEGAKRAHDLLAHAPELAAASFQAACAAVDLPGVPRWLAKDAAAATRADGPRGAQPLWTLCWSSVGDGVLRTEGDRVQIAQKLLAAGADPNAAAERESNFGRLRVSALYGCIHHDRPALLKTLLEAGASPDDGECLYHATEHANERCLDLLLAHGAATLGTNALKRALDYEALGPVRKLLAASADPAERSAFLGTQNSWWTGGRNALHHAVLRGRGGAVIDLLVQHGAPLDARDETGRTAFQIAHRAGAKDAAERLVGLGADASRSTSDDFVNACLLCNEAAARGALANSGVEVPAFAPEDLAALPVAATRGLKGAVKLMLELGFPIDATGGEWSGTALNHAAHMGHPDVVALLLEHGADPEIENEFGGTALGALTWMSKRGDGADGIEAWAPRRTSGTPHQRVRARRRGIASSRRAGTGSRAWRAAASSSVAVATRERPRLDRGISNGEARPSAGLASESVLAHECQEQPPPCQKPVCPSAAASHRLRTDRAFVRWDCSPIRSLLD